MLIKLLSMFLMTKNSFSETGLIFILGNTFQNFEIKRKHSYMPLLRDQERQDLSPKLFISALSLS